MPCSYGTKRMTKYIIKYEKELYVLVGKPLIFGMYYILHTEKLKSM